MSTLISYYPGDRNLELLLAVILVVALASSTAWLVSRRLPGRAALRHLILYSALICCLAAPAAAWFCSAAGLTLVSIPILRADQEGRSPTLVPEPEIAAVCIPPRPSTAPPPVAAAQPLPDTSTTTSANSTIHPSANFFCPPAKPARATPASSAPATQADVQPAVQPADRRAAAPLSFRGIAAAAMLVWAAGALLMLARLLWNCGNVAMLRRSARPLQSEQLQTMLREIAARLGMRRTPLLLQSSRTVIPLAVGLGRGAVVVPARLLESVSNEELRDVLVHEAAHLRRGDQWIVLLQALAEAIYWPILPVHGLNRALRTAREEICDNVVLAECDAIRYGETLLHVAELAVNALRMRAAVGMIEGQGKLERRIAGLVDPARSTKTQVGRTTACAVMLAFIAGCAIASATRFAASAPPNSAAQAASDTAARAEAPIQKSTAAADADDPKLAGHFSGRIAGPDGKPLRHARLFVVPTTLGEWGETVFPADAGHLAVRAETGADGCFEFDAPDMTATDLDGLPTRRPCLLIVTCSGYAPDWTEVWGRSRSAGLRHPAYRRMPVKGTDLNLQLAKDEVPIRGRVLDPGGRPIAGASVHLTSVGIPKGRDLDGYLDRHSKGNAFMLMDDEFERTLTRPGLLPGVTSKTLTDADGRFTLSGIGRDRLCSLTITPPDCQSTDIYNIMTRSSPDVPILQGGLQLSPEQRKNWHEVIRGADFTINIKPVKIDHGRTIHGVVRDRDSREPIAGMLVGPGHDRGDGLLTGSYSTATDAKGRFALSGMIDGQPVLAIPPPGLPYEPAFAETHGDSEVQIECKRGIPFHLKLVDEQRRPVDAEVSYYEIMPSSHSRFYRRIADMERRAANQGRGNYEGFVLSGPGVVVVSSSGFRPAIHVDPKAFFAPGRTNWSPREQITAYGSADKLSVDGPGLLDQGSYAAIVLVNPAPDAAPLELSATVVKDRPRRVFLVDADGKPVVGAHVEGLAPPWFEWWPIRTASVTLTGLAQDRVQRITFVQHDRRLAGSLMARADGDVPYTVVMQPWGTVRGRLVNAKGQPFSGAEIFVDSPAGTNSDPTLGAHGHIVNEEHGPFQIDELVPGQRYSAQIYPRYGISASEAGKAFKKLVLRPGEVRDLGDIQIKPARDAKSGQ